MSGQGAGKRAGQGIGRGIARLEGDVLEFCCHGRRVSLSRPATSADNFDPHSGAQSRIGGHQSRRPAIHDLRTEELRYTTIALGHQVKGERRRGGLCVLRVSPRVPCLLEGLAYFQQSQQQVRASQATIASDCPGIGKRFETKACKIRRTQAHHGFAVGIETHGEGEGQANVAAGLGGREGLFFRGHRLNPSDIAPAFLQPLGLFQKNSFGLGVGHGAQRLEETPCWPDRPGDEDRLEAPSRLTGDFGGPLIEFRHTTRQPVVFRAMQSEPRSVCPEAIGQNKASTGFQEGLMHGGDFVGLFPKPQLGGCAGEQALLEQIRPHGSICQERRSALELFVQLFPEI